MVEHTPVAIILPFNEDFESDLSHWLHSSWFIDTKDTYAGQGAVKDAPGVRMGPDVQHWLVLGSEVTLTNVVNPQLVFFVKGHLRYKSYFRVHYSANGGLTWGELSAANLNYDADCDWQRLQVSLQQFVGQTIRLRFNVNDNSSAPDVEVRLDKITLEDAPTAVTLQPPDSITVSSMRLNWTEATVANFKEYRVYRSETATVDEGSQLVATISDRRTTTFTDTDLMARKTYYYRVYLYNENDTGNGSNQASALTDGMPVPWNDSFETSQAGWTYTGTWTTVPGAGRAGSGALVDSPGDFATSSESYAQFAVNLSGMTWPVLRFWDRHAFGDADWGRLWISWNGDANWQRVYGVSGVRTNWVEQSIDLSPWKNQSQVWVRFQVNTGGTPNDGWYIDDLSLADQAVGQVYPFYDDFEHGLTNWLHAAWTTDANEPWSGSAAAHDTVPTRIPPDTVLWLVLTRELDLRSAVNPMLTFWMKGHLQYKSYFRVQLSADDGVNWTDLPGGLNYDWNADWTKQSISLQAYTNQVVRLRIQTSGNSSAPDEDIYLDNLGIGEPPPAAPTLQRARAFEHCRGGAAHIGS